MNRIRIMGLSLVAVFAFAVMTAASASAEEKPFFEECAKVAVGAGKYANATCSTLGGEKKYERKEGWAAGKKWKGKGGSATLHTPAVSGEVTCTSFADEGFNTGEKTSGKIFSKFSGCKTLEKPCKSAGQAAGVIKTKALKAKLGYIKKAAPVEVGASVSAETGTVLAEFVCGNEEIKIKVEGAVIGKTTVNVNKFSKASTSTFAVNTEGFQVVKHFEGGPEEVLESTINGSGPFESGQQAVAKNTGVVATKINA